MSNPEEQLVIEQQAILRGLIKKLNSLELVDEDDFFEQAYSLIEDSELPIELISTLGTAVSSDMGVYENIGHDVPDKTELLSEVISQVFNDLFNEDIDEYHERIIQERLMTLGISSSAPSDAQLEDKEEGPSTSLNDNHNSHNMMTARKTVSQLPFFQLQNSQYNDKESDSKLKSKEEESDYLCRTSVNKR